MFRKQSLVEYSLVILLIAIGTVSTLTMFGQRQKTTFTKAGTTMNEAIKRSKDYEIAYKNTNSISKFANDVAHGLVPDIPKSGNNGSTAWKNPSAPASNQPPVAKFLIEPAEGIDSNTPINFLNASTDPDNDKIVKEEWENKKTTYPEGTHTVRLRVADDKGNWSAWFSMNITVGNGKPSKPTITIKNLPLNPYKTPIFEVSATDPENDPLTYEWQNKQTTYPLGTHTVMVRAKDSKGNYSDWGSITFSVSVPNTCLDIKQSNPNVKDGEYDVLLGKTTPKKVYCDMTRNGGGWMKLVEYDYDKNKSVVPQGLVDNGKWKNNYNVDIPYAWWVNFSTIASGNYQWKQLIFNTEKYTYSNVMIDYSFRAILTSDGFNNVHNGGLPDRNTIEGQYMDGISITYGEVGSRKHILSYTAYDYPSERNSRLPWLPSNELITGNSIFTVNGNDFVTGTYTKNINKNVNEIIEMRLMTDQHKVDEDIGFKKFVLWIK